MVRDLSGVRGYGAPPTARLWQNFWVRLLAATLGGTVTDLAFDPTDQWLAAIVGTALLLTAVRGLSPRRAWLLGFVWGVAFYLPHLQFTYVSSGTPLAWIALVVVEASITALAPMLMIWAWQAPGLRRSSARAGGGRALVAACLWVLVEQLRANWPWSGLPWGMLAFSQTDGPLVDLAAVGGEVLVSGAVVLSAAFASEAASALLQSSGQWPDLLVEVRAQPGTFAHPVTATLVLGVCSLIVVSLPAVVILPRPMQVGELTAVVAQGNVPQDNGEWLDSTKGGLEGQNQVTLHALNNTDEPIDVVLWPENASDRDPREFSHNALLIDEIARAADAPVLLGIQEYYPSFREAEQRANKYVTWLPGQGIVAEYTKQEPVAFGEYMPMREQLRKITPAVERVGPDMIAGDEPGLVMIPGAGVGREGVPVAVGICFEVAYERVLREGVLLGGEIIVIPTNNTTFGWSRQAAQQADMSRFRAVEFGRTVVQVSTMGVSTIVSPQGQVMWSTRMWEQASTVAHLPRTTELTIAARIGDLPLILAALLGGGAAVAGMVMAKRIRDPLPSVSKADENPHE